MKGYLSARGKIVLSDYREYMQFDLFRGKYARWVRMLVILVVVFACIAGVLAGITLKSRALVLGSAIVLLCFCMFFYLVKRHVKQTCVRQKPFLYATHEVHCGKNGLIYEVLYDPAHNPRHLPDSQQDYLYDDFYRVYETGGFFYFYPTRKSAILLPKRNMTLADVERLRDLLREKLGKRFVRCP